MATRNEAVVIFDYEKTQEDELDLKMGQVIQDVVQADEGWCEGTLNGNRGMFPDNFVKLRPAPTVSTAPPPTSAPPPVDNTVLRGAGGAIKNRRAKVAYSYAAENTDELTLEPGQLVEIVAEEEEGWFRGRLNGKEGVFPSNFLESVPEATTTNNDVVADSHAVDAPVTKQPAGAGVKGPKLFPSINPLEARAKLKHTKPAPSQPEKKAPPPAPTSTPTKLPEKQKPLERAKVTFAYPAENEDEITIAVGDVVEVVSKDSGQEGWWKVKLNDKVGLIPDNFVTVLPVTPPPPSKSAHSSKPPPPLPANESKPTPPQPSKAPAAPNKPLPPRSTSVSKTRPPPPTEPARPPPPVELKHSPILSAKEEHHSEDNADFGVPPTDPLDSSAVKNRPKKSSRPPSRSNLFMEDVSSAEPSPEPHLPPKPEKPSPAPLGLSPWQAELQKRKTTKPAPPKPAVKRPPMKSPAPKSEPEKPPMKPPVASHSHKPPPTVAPAAKPHVDVKPTAPHPPRETPSPHPPPSPVSHTPSSTPQQTPGHAASAPPDDSWKEAYEQLREDFVKFKEHVSSLINTLTEDLDKERKHFAGLEVDIDRLKKRVNTAL